MAVVVIFVFCTLVVSDVLALLVWALKMAVTPLALVSWSYQFLCSLMTRVCTAVFEGQWYTNLSLRQINQSVSNDWIKERIDNKYYLERAFSTWIYTTPGLGFNNSPFFWGTVTFNEVKNKQKCSLLALFAWMLLWNWRGLLQTIRLTVCLGMFKSCLELQHNKELSHNLSSRYVQHQTR